MRIRFASLIVLISIQFMVSCVPQTSGGRERFLSGIVTTPVEDTIPEFDEDPVRPNNAIFINEDYCVCRNSIPYIQSGVCDNICQNYPADQYAIVGSVRLSDELKLDPFFENGFNDWCNKSMPDIDANQDGNVNTRDQNSKCSAEVTEKFNNNSFTNTGEFTVQFRNNNEFQIIFPAGSLGEDKVYDFRFKAKSSLTEAYSDYIQFRVQDSRVFDYGGILPIAQMQSYYCLFKTGSTPNNFEYNYKRHYFHDVAFDPPSFPDEVKNIDCGLDKKNAFKLWLSTERRFFTNYPNGIYNENDNVGQRSDINYFISRLLKAPEFNITANGDFFAPLTQQVFPGNGGNINSIERTIGHYLLPVQDPDNANDFICPDSAQLDYARNNPQHNPLFHILATEFLENESNGALIGTEGLYIAYRFPRQYDPISERHVDDVLLINESQLHDVWFYRDNQNQPVRGPKKTDANYINLNQTHTMYFYWPITTGDPLLQANREMYKVVSIQELNQELNNAGSNFSVPAGAPDKKIGCIPSN